MGGERSSPREVNCDLLVVGSGAAGFMVVTRVAVYDLDKKEFLSDEHDKVFVFRFTTPDELICQTQTQK